MLTSIIFITFVLASTGSGTPSFVKQCLEGNSTNGQIIQITCRTVNERAEYVINDPNGATTLIKNCQFNGCGNIRAKTPVKFINVVFSWSKYGGNTTEDDGGAGGAVTVDNTTATFQNTTFVKCKASRGGAVYVSGSAGSASLSNINATGNTATSGGGGFMLIESGNPVTITKSIFQNNSAYSGGSFFISSGTTLELTDSNFRYGIVSSFFGGGSDIYINNGTLSWIGGSSHGRPSYINNGTLSWIGSNGQTYNNGGSIFIRGLGSNTINATVRKVHYEGHYADGYGGVIYATGLVNLYLDQITSKDVQAGLQGGFGFFQVTTVKITNSRFDNSRALLGGVYVNYGKLTLSNVTSFNSTADIGGFSGNAPYSESIIDGLNVTNSHSIKGYAGAMDCWGCKAIIANSLFDKCDAGDQGQGGAIGMRDTKGNVHLINTTFRNSHAFKGGAIWCTFDNNVTVTNGKFIGNQAGGFGGAVYVQGNAFINFNGSATFISNTAASAGGALHMGFLKSDGPTVVFNTFNLTMRESLANVSGSCIEIENSNGGGLSYTPVSKKSVLEIEGYIHFSSANYVKLLNNSMDPFFERLCLKDSQEYIVCK